MQLHARITGDGPPVVLLHGLFGSSENLGGIARALADDYRVFGIDLRNHGRSPHATAMDHATLAADVTGTIAAHGLGTVTIIGHSLGGKVAMELALSAPDRVSRLVVLDIAPVRYGRQHDRELDALQGIDLARIRSRNDADAALSGTIPDAGIRQFLLKNLQRAGDGFRWRIPLDTIRAGYDAIADAPHATGPYDGPALFVRGGRSDYIPDTARPAIEARFPDATIHTIEGAGHWLHYEAETELLRVLVPFLRGDGGGEA